MSIKSLRKRLNKLCPPDRPWYDPILAVGWDDAAASRLGELHKKDTLSESEKREEAHLEACSIAWSRKHYQPERGLSAYRDPTITDADRLCAFELELQSRTRKGLTPTERDKLDALNVRLDAERRAIYATGWSPWRPDIVEATKRAVGLK